MYSSTCGRNCFILGWISAGRTGFNVIKNDCIGNNNLEVIRCSFFLLGCRLQAFCEKERQIRVRQKGDDLT